jgi:ligand-binding sensor domain-containing protein
MHGDTTFLATTHGIYAIINNRGAYHAVYISGPGLVTYYALYEDDRKRVWLATDNGVIVKPNIYSDNLRDSQMRVIFKSHVITSLFYDKRRCFDLDQHKQWSYCI